MIVLPVLSTVIPMLALAAGGPASNALSVEEPDDPLSIVGGSFAEACQWPSAVSMLENDETPVMCTGSLIHPQVVMTAAHCISPERPIVSVGFGEHGQETGIPERVVSVVDCTSNPNFDLGNGADVGFCILSEEVLDVPIVPLMAGCEVEEIDPGDEVYIVGFGADFGSWNPQTEELTVTGVGAKRWTTQTVDFIDQALQEIYLYGSNGSDSACFGDSGGPALMQLADGTWRVFGTGGHLYDPGGFPAPMIPDNICGAGVAYGFAPFVIEWLEQDSGFDLTPCWNGNVWDPSPACVDFPLDPAVGGGSWAAGCSGGLLGTSEAPACADVPPPPPPPPPPPGTGSSGDDLGDDSDDGSGTTGGDPTGMLPGGTGDDESGPVPPLEDSSAVDGDSSGGAGLGDDGGSSDQSCSCQSGRSPSSTPALWLLLAGLGARRRRSRLA